MNTKLHILPIHFGNLQGKHEINTDSLLIFVKSYKDIADVFGLNIEIQIAVPEEGGWKANLVISLVVAISSPLAVPLVTGETAEYWGKKGHEIIIKQINDFLTKQAKDVLNEVPKECIKQKNKMYEKFQADECIDSFRMGDMPAIPSNNFSLYIKKLPDKEYFYLGETDITVHSPDWEGRRSWGGKIEILANKKSAFTFDKNLTGKFWEKVELDALSLHTTDVMRVQLVKRPTNKVKYLVIRVLTYNEVKVDDLLEEKEIKKVTTFDHSGRYNHLRKKHNLF